MTIYTNTPYLYAIGWTELDKWYLGVRYSVHASPDDLWVSYFTSSKYVKEFRAAYGEPYHIEVLATGTKEHVANAEREYIVLYGLHKDNRWLNMSPGGVHHAVKPEAIAKRKATLALPEVKLRKSQSMTERWKDPDFRERRAQGKENSVYDITVDYERSKKIASSLSGKKKSEEAKANMRAAWELRRANGKVGKRDESGRFI